PGTTDWPGCAGSRAGRPAAVPPAAPTSCARGRAGHRPAVELGPRPSEQPDVQHHCFQIVQRAWPRDNRNQAAAPEPRRSADGRAGGERLDVGGAQGVPADPPLTAGDLFDDDPGDRAHVLALDLDHRLGEVADDPLLLLGVEHTLDELDVDQWHCEPPSPSYRPAAGAL